MAVILIKSPRGQTNELPLVKPLFKIGKKETNDLVINHPAISREHCELFVHGGQFYIRDLGSRNGTYVNGNRISADTLLMAGTRINLGDIEVTYFDQAVPPEARGVQPPAQAPQAPPQQPQAPGFGGYAPPQQAPFAPPQQQQYAPPAPAPFAQPPQAPVQYQPPPPPAPFPQQAPPQQAWNAPPQARPQGFAPGSQEFERLITLKQKIHDRLVNEIGLRKASISGMDDVELRKRTEETIGRMLQELHAEIPPGMPPQVLQKDIVNEALGLGPIEDLLAEETVNEIMVNRWDRIYIERKGKIVLSDKCFTNNSKVLDVIRRILAPIGRRIDESSPMVDARLADGSRVNAIIHPLALSGPTITIRKFAKKPFVISDLVRFGSLAPQMAEFMQLCVENRKNIIISGGTGSGKTTLLNVLSSFIPNDERIVTVEDAAELKLPQEHVVSLESRPPNIEGKGAIVIRDLVKNCLRMRPDRIVVGECRGGEALDMLQAMNTGHDGSLTTLHANTARDALARLETLVLFAGTELPARAIREQISSAIQLIIQQNRLVDGTRKIISISEVVGMEGDVITMQDIYKFDQRSFDANGKVVGKFVSTGNVPKFIQELRQRGVHVDMNLFTKGEL